MFFQVTFLLLQTVIIFNCFDWTFQMTPSGTEDLGASAIRGMASNCCCAYTGGNCTCGGYVSPMGHHGTPMPLGEVRHRFQHHPAPAKLRTKDESRTGGGDRPRKNKSPKISNKEETVPVATAPTANDAAATKVESVPLPAFQQAFGSTEIGRFSGAFVRSDGDDNGDRSITEEMVRDAIWSQLGEGLGEEWRDPSTMHLDACFETLPPEPAPVWSHNPAPTTAHHIYWDTYMYGSILALNWYSARRLTK